MSKWPLLLSEWQCTVRRDALSNWDIDWSLTSPHTAHCFTLQAKEVWEGGSISNCHHHEKLQMQLRVMFIVMWQYFFFFFRHQQQDKWGSLSEIHITMELSVADTSFFLISLERERERGGGAALTSLSLKTNAQMLTVLHGLLLHGFPGFWHTACLTWCSSLANRDAPPP